MAKLFLALAGPLAAAACLAGCGGSSNSTATPAAATKTYLTGIGNGDAGQACAALAPTLQRAALQSARTQGIKASSCADLFGQVSAHLDNATKEKFKHAKVTSVTTSGNTAVVTVAGASDHPTLTKVGSKWLITGGIGF